MIRLALAAALAASFAAPALAADGEQLFLMQCKLCHGPAGGGTAMGPSLAGVAGGKIAAGTFAYSPALKAKEGTWTDANLDAFLTSPAAFAPGTRMFATVPSEENRAALTAYLKTLK
ncbi:MAG: c-type cytochrome [Phenylobacterium sp.]